MIDGTVGRCPRPQALLETIRRKKKIGSWFSIKADLLSEEAREKDGKEICQCLHMTEENQQPLWVSATRLGQGIFELKERIRCPGKQGGGRLEDRSRIWSGGDFVVLVVPIDKAAPKGRLILPQQQTIRDLLEAGGLRWWCGRRSWPTPFPGWKPLRHWSSPIARLSEKSARSPRQTSR